MPLVLLKVTLEGWTVELSVTLMALPLAVLSNVTG